MSITGPRYAGQSPNHLTTKEKRAITQKEANLAKGPSRFPFSLKVKCPICGRILRCNHASLTREWITQCGGLHAWKVNSEDGLDRVKLESIPFNDPAFPRRNIKT